MRALRLAMTLCVSALAVSSGAQGASWSLSASPNTGSAAFDVPVQYTLTFQHATSGNQFNVVYGLISTALDGGNACFFSYVLNPIAPGQPSGFHLVNDAGNGLVTPSSGGVYENSQCSVRNVTVLPSGTTLTLTAWIAFRRGFGGDDGGTPKRSKANKIIYLAALDLSGLNSGWQPSGTVTVGDQPWTNQQVLSGTPGRSQARAVTYRFSMQNNSSEAMGVANVLINGGIDGLNACWLGYGADGTVVLVTDRGDDSLVLGPNPWDSVSNSQCRVWRGTAWDGTSQVTSGNRRELQLKVEFNANWRGGKTIYAALRSASEASNSGWQAVGTWMQAPSGGNVVTSGLQVSGAAGQQLTLSYRTPFPDDLAEGQINLSGQVDSYQSACQMSWTPSGQLVVAGVVGSFVQGSGNSSICTVAPGGSVTSTAEGFDVSLMVWLSPQLLATFPNRGIYLATGAAMGSGSGGQPIRALNPAKPVRAITPTPQPNGPLGHYIYNDNLWYYLENICYDCKQTGIRTSGAGLQARCVTLPTNATGEPMPEEPPAVSCASAARQFSDDPNSYWVDVAFKAPRTTNAPSLWGVFVDSFSTVRPGWIITWVHIMQVRPAPPCTAGINIQTSGVSLSKGLLGGYSSLTLTSLVQSPGGTYTWTSSNPAAFSIAGWSTGRNLSSIAVNVNAPGKATLKVSYRLDCGAIAEDSIDLVLTKDITVFGWINGDAIPLPTGATRKLVEDLNDGLKCLATLSAWSDAGKNGGLPTSPFFDGIFHVTEDVDRRYANAFLVKMSGNSDPGSSINRTAIQLEFDSGVWKFAHRAYNRFQAFFVVRSGRILPNISRLQDRADAGYTPNPCTTIQAPLPVQAPEVDPLNGQTGVSAAGDFVYHINQTRVGAVGQAGDTYLNDRTSNTTYGIPGNTTPWTWSVIQFDSSGTLRVPLTTQVFPTYYVFEDDTRIAVRPQSVLEPFVSLSSSSRFIP